MRHWWLLPLLALVLASCSSQQPSQDRAPKKEPSGSKLPPDAVPRREPRARYGNPSSYEVYGIKYYVKDTSYGYRERGVASWYGTKFHGRPTSSMSTSAPSSRAVAAKCTALAPEPTTRKRLELNVRSP